MITLYHGSNVAIEAIDFSKSKPGKDFGVGFYLSANEEQAREMAEKKALLFGGEPVITRFEFDEEGAKADATINYLRYEAYSLEWGQFVHANRKNKTLTSLHNYDIIYGPIANDNIGFQMRRFDANLIDWEQFVEELHHKGARFTHGPLLAEHGLRVQHPGERDLDGQVRMKHNERLRQFAESWQRLTIVQPRKLNNDERENGVYGRFKSGSREPSR